MARVPSVSPLGAPVANGPESFLGPHGSVKVLAPGHGSPELLRSQCAEEKGGVCRQHLSLKTTPHVIGMAIPVQLVFRCGFACAFLRTRAGPEKWSGVFSKEGKGVGRGGAM